jgi:hypothetical protein
MIKLIYDSNDDSAISVTMDRHVACATEIDAAITEAILRNDANEASQGFGPITGQELAWILASVVSGICEERGVSRSEFLEAFSYL